MRKRTPRQLGAAWPNMMYFPQALRDAIPTFQPCLGRSLRLASIEGQCQHSVEFGRRVLIRFLVEETGRQRTEFEVYAEVDVEAARALAESLRLLADQVEQMQPMTLTPPVYRKKR